MGKRGSASYPREIQLLKWMRESRRGRFESHIEGGIRLVNERATLWLANIVVVILTPVAFGKSSVLDDCACAQQTTKTSIHKLAISLSVLEICKYIYMHYSLEIHVCCTKIIFADSKIRLSDEIYLNGASAGIQRRSAGMQRRSAGTRRHNMDILWLLLIHYDDKSSLNCGVTKFATP